GRYEIERPLGHGAMAVVDLARDVELGRPVALKRLAENLARDDDLRARFVREARLAGRLAHPNVVRIYDVGEADGRPLIAMGLEGTQLTVAGTVLGTAAYLAPEQARGERVTAAADIYALGAVLYELLSGQPPRSPATLGELARPGRIERLAGVPSALAAVVMRCLAADPRRRPASARE